jgi:pantothenate synthetase
LAPNFKHGCLIYVPDPDRAESSRPAGLTAEAQELIEKLTQDLQKKDQVEQQMRKRLERIEEYAEQQRQWQEQLTELMLARNFSMPPPPPPLNTSSPSAAAVVSPEYDGEDVDDPD